MMDELNEITGDITLHAMAAQMSILVREAKESKAHRVWHRKAWRVAKWVAGTVGGLLLGIAGWGATEFRGRVESQARAQAAEVAVQRVNDARAEHAELRARDQELDSRVRRNERDIQAVAMHRLEVAREARPR